MPTNSVNVHTFTCSVPDCEESKTISGDLQVSKQKAVNVGWSFGSAIYAGKQYDLCRQHNKNIAEFLGVESNGN